MRNEGDALVVAGVSVRALAESARQGGWRPIALDLFGDRDTRRASERWMPIGEPGMLAIDPQRLAEALARAARECAAVGWVPGAGFEGAPHLLADAPAGLPLLGMPAAPVAALREARHFFGTLQRLGLPCPQTRFEPPEDAAGWLAKRAGGTGGWHIRWACDLRDPAGRARGGDGTDLYYQRHQPGTPMSALFLADGRQARLVGLNRLLVSPLGSRPHVYHGAIGPIEAPALQARVEAALAALAPAFGLRGLASLDFVEARGTPWLLEINPRPSASLVLHAHAWPGGLLRAHVRAVQGRLPGPPARAGSVRGARILFARRACTVGTALAEALDRMTDCHDLPAPQACFAQGDPVCSVTAEAADPDAVEAALAERLAWVENRLQPLQRKATAK